MKAPDHLKYISLGLLIPHIPLWYMLFAINFNTILITSLPSGLIPLCGAYMILFGAFGTLPVGAVGAVCSGMYAHLSQKRKWYLLTLFHILLSAGAWFLVIRYSTFVT